MKKYYLTVNPHGGIKKGKEILTKVVPLFDNANIALTIIETEYAGHARDLAKELPMMDIMVFVVLAEMEHCMNQLMD